MSKSAIVIGALNRIKQPSTWAGLSVLAVMFGIPPGTMDLALQIITGVAAAGAIVLNEQPAPVAPPEPAPTTVQNGEIPLP